MDQQNRHPEDHDDHPQPNMQSQQPLPRNQPPQSRRFSSNNPFMSAQSNPYSSQLPNSIPQPHPPQAGYSDIRPISVSVNDAFDYSSYNLSLDSPNIASFPSGAPLLPHDAVAQWSSPSSSRNLHSAAGPPIHQSQLQSPPFSSSSSTAANTILHTQRRSSLSTISPIENEKKTLDRKVTSPHFASKYEPQNAARLINPNDMAEQRKQSFAVDPAHDVIDLDAFRSVDLDKYQIDTRQTEEIFETDESVANRRQAMKRHRMATQRHIKGRPEAPAKRSKSFGKKRHPENPDDVPSTPQLPSFDIPPTIDSSMETETNHKVYFNLPLPEDMIDPETDLPASVYPRNKVRTTKYTPLSFVPKNIYFQFKNIANIYFLFTVVLGVRIHFLFTQTPS